ncbi:MAG: branched-chain amino acid transport system substrate-binding protein [Pseudonocardiales bacterium]|nr:branched-chain amino acid transport system substrate-binding protein [Pseudonocardiales bacterium]
MTGTHRRRTRVVAAVTAIALVGLMACGSTKTKSGGNAAGDTSAPGVTKDSILVGTTQPLTGPAAPGYSKISAAMTAYFKYANEQGGVNGRKVTLKVLDDGYNPANTATKTRQLVLQDKVFALLGSLGTPTHTAVLDFIKTNKVPDLFVASGSRSWNQPAKYPTTFGWQPDYTVEGKILGDYVKKTFAGKKVCSFGQGDDFGTDGVQGVEAVLGSTALASKQTYTPTNTNVGPQVAALKSAGCQVVVSFTVPGFTALELGTAAKLGFHPQFVVSNVGSDIVTLTGFLKEATVPLLEGMVSDSYLPIPTDASNSWIKLFQTVNQKYNNNVPFDGNVLYGMSVAYTFLQAVKAAGKPLNRGSLTAAVEKGGFTGPGLTPFRFSASDHSGFAGTQVAVIKGGVATPTGSIFTTDDSNGPLTVYSGSAATAPANGLP